MRRRRLAIIGSTGSIGKQALDVVSQHRDLFGVELLTANNNAAQLAMQAREFGASAAVVCNEDKYTVLRDALDGSGVKAFAGMSSACSLLAAEEVDMVLVCTVGFSGLRPTVAAIEAGKPVALANKETLVAGGAIVMEMVRKHNVPLLPVDSEHSAIFQCLMGAAGNKIRKIHLTASGGPFRNWKTEYVYGATKEQALRHPRWTMGAKITVDSASMMNKGFEMIEARWLFDTKPEDINIVIHPESIIHSMVEFVDGAVIAQLGHPDMREPIQFALSFPERLSLDNKKLDFAELGSLSFAKPDPDKFPCLRLAFEAIGRGGNIPCVMNAANDAAVAAFLGDRIPFGAIPEIIGECMAMASYIPSPSLEDIFACNDETFAKAAEMINKKSWQS